MKAKRKKIICQERWKKYLSDVLKNTRSNVLDWRLERDFLTKEIIFAKVTFACLRSSSLGGQFKGIWGERYEFRLGR